MEQEDIYYNKSEYIETVNTMFVWCGVRLQVAQRSVGGASVVRVLDDNRLIS